MKRWREEGVGTRFNMPSKRQRGWEESGHSEAASRSKWMCDYCNTSFESYTDACEHENHCGSRKPSGDAASHALSAAVAAAVAAAAAGGAEGSSFAEKSLAVSSDRALLSELDYLLCRNVEMFAASDDDVRDSAYSDSSCGSASVVGQMGLRCLHCSRSPLATAGFASVFPGSVGSIGKSLRMMGEYHFKRCGMCQTSIKDGIQRAWDNREEGDEGQLEEFCVNVLAKRMGVLNMIPSKTGVIFSSNRCMSRYPPPKIKTDSDSTGAGLHYSMSPPLDMPQHSQPLSRGPPPVTPMHHRYPSAGSIITNRGPIHSAPASTSAGSSYYTTSTTRAMLPSTHVQQPIPQHPPYMPHTSPYPPYPQPGPGPPRYDISHAFIRDSMGWSCRHCSSVPYHYRAPGSVSPTLEPPSRSFIEQHLAICHGMGMYSPAPQQHQPIAPYPSPPQSPNTALQYLISHAPPQSPRSLVLPEDKLLLTDYFYHLIQQLRLCRFSESDRKTRGGKRENIKPGFGGLECRHCANANPNSSRKFFWSNVDRLANSFAEIPSHVLKCRNCEQGMKNALMVLKTKHPEQMAKLPRGSQKVFFRRMWRRVHMESDQTTVKSEETSSADQPAEDTSKHPPSPGQIQTPVLLAIPEDKDWLSDTDCFVRRNLQVFCATEEDLTTAHTDRKYPICLNQVGIRCLHCAQSSKGARGNAVSFPYSIDGIYESVRELQKLHLESCSNLPPSVKSELTDLKTSTSLSSVLRRYYVLAAKALGMVDTPDGIRLGGEAVGIGSATSLGMPGILGTAGEIEQKEDRDATEGRKRKSPESLELMYTKKRGLDPEHPET